jgi:hypothetical protein
MDKGVVGGLGKPRTHFKQDGIFERRVKGGAQKLAALIGGGVVAT